MCPEIRWVGEKNTAWCEWVADPLGSAEAGDDVSGYTGLVPRYRRIGEIGVRAHGEASYA